MINTDLPQCNTLYALSFQLDMFPRGTPKRCSLTQTQNYNDLSNQEAKRKEAEFLFLIKYLKSCLAVVLVFGRSFSLSIVLQ